MEEYHPFRSSAARDEYLAHYDERSKSWPVVPSETRLVHTKTFGETFVRNQGLADGKPLILLPGDAENSLSWIPVIKSLSATYRTYAVDHIYDRGRSVYSRPPRCPDDFVQWFDELLGALELGSKPRLLCHSYGGWIASLYALAHPDRIEKLVLLAPCATVLPPPPGLMVRAMLYYFIPFRFVLWRYLYWYAPDAVRTFKTRGVIDDMIEEQMLVRKCYKPMKFIPPTVLNDEEWEKLDRQVPILFLVGENDVTYSAQKACNRLEKVAPHIKSMICPGADHHVSLVKPKWVVEKVLEFLK